MMSVDQMPARSAEAAGSSRNAPVIVMGYAGSGAGQLRPVLSGFPELACTQRTGIVPLCHQALTAWQEVDDRGAEGISPLAAASVRALCGGLVTAILAREGGSRWCEFTSAPPAAARAFARLYPGARFLIVHRRADTMMRAITGAGRWGLAGQEFAPFVPAHPANPVAALASYWAARTARQLEFEQENPGACHRVRIEDLTGNAAQALPDISDFLALDGAHMSPSFTRDDEWDRQADTGAPDAAPGFPLDQIPGPLLAQVNDLHRSLGYHPVTAAASITG
jgi:hypothetical protein